MRQYINDEWEFTEEYADALNDPGCALPLQNVRIPHTVRETPLHYFDEGVYQMVSGYRRRFSVPEAWRGQRVFVTFEGVAHSAVVRCNGAVAGEHRCGYTAFTLELTDLLRYGAENLLTVRVDSRETQDVPPFGGAIDYMTYGGIYRDVYLDVRPACHIADVFVCGPVPERLRSSVTFRGDPAGLALRQRVFAKGEAEILAEGVFAPGDMPLLKAPGAQIWDVDRPFLYTLETALLRGDEVVDSVETVFGFRHAEFREDGFRLNGRKLLLRGLNRHQSYPYVGYAMPAAMQRLDAEILKRELGLNAVRTSHYPQSQDFISRCDELGLLVFMEIPGWQHIGGEEWKAQALRNVEEMVRQYRNHPSVILWGVRINESQDDDALYRKTNAMARSLDPTRPTGGVRYLKKSSFLEDVYTFNDFSHDGTGAGCLKKSAVTPDVRRAYLISEYNGHMFPTKSYDSEQRRTEHALRHARVLDAVAGAGDIAGSFGWCFADYNTHRDFGSGDRVCYHGVMDMFRNPKTAAFVYTAQQEETPVLELSSSMDIGENPESVRGDVYLLTNADSVRMYRNGVFIKEYFREDSPFRSLPHGPILIDDYIGGRMREQEGFGERQDRVVREVLNAAARSGISRLSAKAKARAAEALAVYRMSFSDAIRLYQKYIGDWGSIAEGFRFEAIRNGEVVAEKVCAPMTRPALRFQVSHTVLTEGRSYDVAAVRVQVCDENGNTLHFWNTPLPLSLSGAAELIGPKRCIPVSGGQGCAYIRSAGVNGRASLRITLPEEWDPAGKRGWTLDFRVKGAKKK